MLSYNFSREINFKNTVILISTIAASIGVYDFFALLKDPRAKLTENGISWKNESFITTTENEDIEVIKL